MSRPHPSLIKALKLGIPRGSSLIVAVSGGIDSVALLHALNSLKEELTLVLEVAHIDHRLRTDSALDAAFVKDLAETFHLPFHLHVVESGPEEGSNIEGWGRKVRYDFLTKIRSERDLDWIITAHTADDVAETLLMRLISNKEPKSISACEEQRRLLRPLLAVPRMAVQSYASEHKLSFREDPTNQDTDFLRNRVRHLVLPLLAREFDQRIVESLSERATAIQEDLNTLYQLCETAVTRASTHSFGSREWLRAVKLELSAMSDGVQWRFAELLVKTKVGFNLGRVKSREVVRLLLQQRQGVELPGGAQMRLQEGGISFTDPKGS